MRNLELDLADGLPEVLALGLRDLELERRGLARAVSARERARTPRRACGDKSDASANRPTGIAKLMRSGGISEVRLEPNVYGGRAYSRA